MNFEQFQNQSRLYVIGALEPEVVVQMAEDVGDSAPLGARG